MSNSATLPFLSVTALTQGFRNGTFSPVDVVQCYADRIARHNPALNAFLDLRLNSAMEEAQQSLARWAKGAPLSPIDGIACGIKANIAVAGLPWHGGIGALRNRLASDDAACVKRLKAGGVIILGTLNMHEGALGATTDNPHFGRCNNPWRGEGDIDRTPGGSSGGSGAAVAARLCTFALGTDTMGSVRVPSAYCGIAGHKPSSGLIDPQGLVDLSPTLDHIGPHGVSAADLALILPVLAGVDLSAGKPLQAIAVADPDRLSHIEPGVLAEYRDSIRILRELGPVTLIDLENEFDFGALRRKGLLVSEVEGYAVHASLLQIAPDGISPELRAMLEWGHDQPADKQAAAYDAVRAAGEKLKALLERFDIVVTPTTPQGPFAFGAPVPANQADFTCLANFAGVPATAVPASSDGAPPASIQFIASPGRDGLCLAIASAFEELRGPAPIPSRYEAMI